MLPASEVRIGTNGHPLSGPESQIRVSASKDRCRVIWKIRETQKSSRRSRVTANVLSPGVAAAIPIKSCHGFDRTDIKRLTEHVSGAAPVTLIVPQHCHLSPLLYPSVIRSGAQLYEPQLDNAKLAASLLQSSVRLLLRAARKQPGFRWVRIIFPSDQAITKRVLGARGVRPNLDAD
jgi:hypothetical protein